MRTAHVVSIGSEGLCSLNPYCEEGYVIFLLNVINFGTESAMFLSYFCRRGSKLTYDTRTNLALFRSLSATDYIAAQQIR